MNNIWVGYRIWLWKLWPIPYCPICGKKLLLQGWEIDQRYYCEDSCEFEKLGLGHKGG